jgi:hypothetical protein
VVTFSPRINATRADTQAHLRANGITLAAEVDAAGPLLKLAWDLTAQPRSTIRRSRCTPSHHRDPSQAAHELAVRSTVPDLARRFPWQGAALGGVAGYQPALR